MIRSLHCFARVVAIAAAIFSIWTGRGFAGDLSHKKPGYYGGDGSSQEQAVIAIGFDNSPEAWINKKYPGSAIKDQSLVVPPKGAKAFDVYRVEKSDGTMTDVWFSASGGMDDLFSKLASHEHPVIDLSGKDTDAGDGFRIKFDPSWTTTMSRTTGTGSEYVFAIYDVYIPLRVGKSSLDQVGLEVLGNDGRTLVYAPLESHKENKQTLRVHVCVDRELAAQSTLRCTYYDPSSEEIVKEYLIRLKDRLRDNVEAPK